MISSAAICDVLNYILHSMLRIFFLDRFSYHDRKIVFINVTGCCYQRSFSIIECTQFSVFIREGCLEQTGIIQ